MTAAAARLILPLALLAFLAPPAGAEPVNLGRPPLWSAHGPNSGPGRDGQALSADGSTIFSASEVPGSSMVTAMDVSTGAIRWSTGAGPPSPGPVVATAGAVFSLSGGSQLTVAARSPATGSVMWTTTRPTSQRTRVLAASPSSSAVFVAYSTLSTWRIDRLSGATGALEWTTDVVAGVCCSSLPSAIALSSDLARVFVAGQDGTNSGGAGGVRAVSLDAGNGAQLWNMDHAAASVSGLTSGTDLVVSPDGTTVFVAASEQLNETDSYLFAFDATSGALKWTYVVDSEQRTGAEPKVAVAPDGGSVYLLSSASVWTPARPLRGQPQVVPNQENILHLHALATPANVSLYALDAATGGLRWGSAFYRPLDLVVSPDSRTIVVTGHGYTAVGSVTTTAFTSLGSPMWTAVHELASTAPVELPAWSGNDVLISADDAVVVRADGSGTLTLRY